jgi:hypothetical protein
VRIVPRAETNEVASSRLLLELQIQDDAALFAHGTARRLRVLEGIEISLISPEAHVCRQADVGFNV